MDGWMDRQMDRWKDNRQNVIRKAHLLKTTTNSKDIGKDFIC